MMDLTPTKSTILLIYPPTLSVISTAPSLPNAVGVAAESLTLSEAVDDAALDADWSTTDTASQHYPHQAKRLTWKLV